MGGAKRKEEKGHQEPFLCLRYGSPVSVYRAEHETLETHVSLLAFGSLVSGIGNERVPQLRFELPCRSEGDHRREGAEESAEGARAQWRRGFSPGGGARGSAARSPVFLCLETPLVLLFVGLRLPLFFLLEEAAACFLALLAGDLLLPFFSLALLLARGGEPAAGAPPGGAMVRMDPPGALVPPFPSPPKPWDWRCLSLSTGPYCGGTGPPWPASARLWSPTPCTGSTRIAPTPVGSKSNAKYCSCSKSICCSILSSSSELLSSPSLLIAELGRQCSALLAGLALASLLLEPSPFRNARGRATASEGNQNDNARSRRNESDSDSCECFEADCGNFRGISCPSVEIAC